ncbi:NADPH-dependent FMN reductase [Streptomyces sp. NPDC048604]|uniref:NADPH-dependent FMN reductase n=1 Tax=Streptomyces sp. NPDC048604 TaxID=3365578 RepID=UPI0037238013
MDITTPSAQLAPATPATAPEPLKLALVIGSDRAGRFGTVIADWFLTQVADRPDFTVDIVDVAEHDLPTAFSPNPDEATRAALAEVTPRLAAADAYVVLTPEYNHSYPAGLKNLIDRHFGEWQAKPVAFVSYGGISGGLRAVEHLRQVFAELHAVTVRDTVSFTNAWTQFDGEGTHRDPAAVEAAAKSLLDQLAWWGRALKDAKSRVPYTG